MFYLYAQLEPKGARTRPNWTQVSNGEWFYLKKKVQEFMKKILMTAVWQILIKNLRVRKISASMVP